MDPILGRLIRRIGEQWERAHFLGPALPEIAAGALEDLQLYRRLDPVRLLRELLRRDGGESGRIGEHRSPTIIPLFSGARFNVDVHTWGHQLGEPHSHTWAGAYQVLQGTSVAGTFSWQQTVELDPRLRLGVLKLRQLELQRAGRTVPVVPGTALIHGQSYPDLPGFAISVRGREPWGHLTYSYWPPGLQFETTPSDAPTVRQLRALDALFEVDPRECARALEEICEKADPRTLLVVLRHARARFRKELDMEGISRRAAVAFGRHAPLVVGALAAIDRKAELAERRSATRDWDLRFLFSLLFLAPDRATVLRLVREQYPKRNAERLVRNWVVALASTPGLGDRTLLGTPPDPDLPALLARMLDDERPESVLDGLSEDYDAADIRAKEPLLRRAIQAMRDLPLLQPLFIRERARAVA